MTRHTYDYPAPSYDDPPARLAEQIEPKPMRIEVHDYAPTTQRRRYVDAGWLLGLGIVACVSGMVALVMLVWGMW